jgi:hypothetical protein
MHCEAGIAHALQPLHDHHAHFGMTCPLPVTVHHPPEAVWQVGKHCFPGGRVSVEVVVVVVGTTAEGPNLISSIAMSPDHDPAVVPVNLTRIVD